MIYHHIGTQIIEAQNKAGWGAKVIDQLSKELLKQNFNIVIDTALDGPDAKELAEMY